jgi:hypothetical protein
MSPTSGGNKLRLGWGDPKRGQSGRGRTRTAGLTDVNPANGDHADHVILLEVESFNN